MRKKGKKANTWRQSLTETEMERGERDSKRGGAQAFEVQKLWKGIKIGRGGHFLPQKSPRFRFCVPQHHHFRKRCGRKAELTSALQYDSAQSEPSSKKSHSLANTNFYFFSIAPFSPRSFHCEKDTPRKQPLTTNIILEMKI